MNSRPAMQLYHMFRTSQRGRCATVPDTPVRGKASALLVTRALGSCAAAALLLLAAPVLAQGYAGNGISVPANKAAAPKLTLNAGAVNVPAGTASKRANEWKAYGSYQFTETWGAEFNYSNWGRTGTGATAKPGTEPAVPAAGDAALVPRGSQLDFAATGTLPLIRGLSLYGKLGYGRSEVGASPYCLGAACGPVTSSHQAGTRAGLGLRYSFSGSWGLRLDYENVNTLNTPNTLPAKGDSWSARIKYTF